MKLPLTRISRFSIAFTACLAAGPTAFLPLAHAQTALPPASAGMMSASLPAGAPAQQAGFLVDQALKIAAQSPGAAPKVVRGAAALLPRLLPGGSTLGRNTLTKRWISLAMKPAVPRAVRLEAFNSFFDIATKTDLGFASSTATQIPDFAARAGAYLDVSRAYEATRTPNSWMMADKYAAFSQTVARREPDLATRARALTFVAYRMVELSPARQEEALKDATSQVKLVQSPRVRDNLLAELTGALARFDLNQGRRLAATISDEGLKNLASARVNLTEVSQTTLTTRSRERITALASAAAPYDARALPILLQLPPQPEVLKAISDTLPKIYPTARPNIEVSQLERIWNYSLSAPTGPYRDQLQSRAARLMVLQDLWRGRSWGKQLSWKGGRVQVGAFLNEVLTSRRSNLGSGTLQDVAQTDVETAVSQASKFAPAARAEALLLIAGQILG